MVISIETIRSGVAFESAMNWPDTGTDEASAKDWETDFAPGRGILCGLLFSGILWAGLILGFRALVLMLA